MPIIFNANNTGTALFLFCPSLRMSFNEASVASVPADKGKPFRKVSQQMISAFLGS